MTAPWLVPWITDYLRCRDDASDPAYWGSPHGARVGTIPALGRSRNGTQQDVENQRLEASDGGIPRPGDGLYLHDLHPGHA